MRQRTPLAVLELQGSGNIARFNAREKAEKDAPPLPPDRKAEIEQLDGLIAKCMKACAKGSTRNKKGNPAFGQLAILVRVRAQLTHGHVAPEDNAADVIAAADAMLFGKAN
jgi:hypothetical protein